MEEGQSYAWIGYSIQYTSLFPSGDEVFFRCSAAARLPDNATGHGAASGNANREETAIDN